MQKHPELPQAFADLGIEIPLLKALLKMGFSKPSEIQTQLIPPALAGRDLLGQARTGTGKTAAFGLPVLQQIDPVGRLQALCLVPTRELAVQVAAEIMRLAAFSGIHVVPIYGGQKVAAQLHQLGGKTHFVVGTPGRVMDFMKRGNLSTKDIRFVVLDEVDRMLDIGFRDDIRAILGRIDSPHQTIFVSATIDEEINRLARAYMRNPLEINVSQDKLTVEEVDQSYITTGVGDKFRVLLRLLEEENPPVAIVFCNTKAAARKITKKFHDVGIEATEIHGDLEQRKRDRVMSQFRKNQIRVLVATDLAARGIDVSSITHIINYDIPPDPQVYVHRIGRTARMGARGKAITFVNLDEGYELTRIEMLINRQIPARDLRGYSPSPPRELLVATAPKDAPAGHPQPATTGGISFPAASPQPKTLGGRFRPMRGRRR